MKLVFILERLKMNFKPLLPGPYESGVGSFKHFYFNASKNTIKIWVTTVLSIIVFYESIKRLLDLGLKDRLRYSMLTLFVSAVFSHYYSW